MDTLTASREPYTLNGSSGPGAMVFALAGRVVLKINADGSVERGDSFSDDHDASRAFLDVLARCAPNYIADLRLRCERAEARLAKLEGREVPT